MSLHLGRTILFANMQYANSTWPIADVDTDMYADIFFHLVTENIRSLLY